jgi:two-component system nitrogen regulation response regulator GlnG
VTKIIVIDDDRAVRLMVEKGLENLGFQVIAASMAMEGLRLVEVEQPDVALVDICMPEVNGFELFRKIRAMDSKIPMIFVTSDCSSETTIQAMRLGAFDYLAKPINLEQLRKLTVSAVQSRRLMDQPVVMPLSGEGEKGDRFIGRSDPMLEVFKSIGRVSGQNVTVLIRGESGCGKELVARAILQHSERESKPHTAVNCAAIPDQLLESELFGHEKGAFTGADQRRKGKFEQCDGGTIFLDEIGDMSLVVQGKVLRLIQDQRFQRLGGNDEIVTDVRIIAATNRDLEEMVAKGEFREDLLYRLNGYTIDLPPLRDRREDIPLLLEYFLKRERRDMGKLSLQGVAPASLAAIVAYHWPGNVRQLQSVIRHAMLHTTGTVLGPESLPSFVFDNRAIEKEVPDLSDEKFPDKHVPFEMESSTPSFLSKDDSVHEEFVADLSTIDIAAFIEARMSSGTSNLYSETIDEDERYLFAKTLQATGGNQSKAADILGITRGKVRDRIAYFGIQLDRAVSFNSGE